MKTITGVPIAETGIEYPASTGPVTFTVDDLADMVASQDDPAIVAPRLKIGHTDPRFNILLADGEPAFGIATNLRLENNGNTVVCDYEGVPDWLADVLPTTYPNRSVEGYWDAETVTGHKWRFVCTDVALLGVVWPGISTLDDLQIAISDAGPEGVEVGTTAAAMVMAETVSDTAWGGFKDSDYDDAQYARACIYDRAKCSDTWKSKTTKQRYSLRVREPDGTLNRNGCHAAAGRIGAVTNGCDAAKKAAATTLINLYKNQLKEDPPDGLTKIVAAIAASVNLEDVRRQFYDEVATQETGRYWWWVRAVLLDPNELIVDDDDGGLYRIPFETNGDEVTFSDPVSVKINYVDAPEPIAAGAGMMAAVYDSRPNREEVHKVDPKTKKQPVAANVDLSLLRKHLGLNEDSTEEEVNAALEAAAKEPESAPSDEPGSEKSEAAMPSAEQLAASGLMIIDKATVAELQRQAGLGASAYESQRVAARDTFLASALAAGKFPPSRLEHWTQAWETEFKVHGNADGIKATIEQMPAGLIPVSQMGGQPLNAEGVSTEAYPKNWLPEVARREARNQRITQES